jgi:hypothetical protein
MARYKDGINGAFIGKVGSVVGYQRKGVSYMRSLPKVKKHRAVSEKEQANRERFAAAQAWLQPLTGYVRLGYKNYSPRCEGFVAAKSYLMKHAMSGSFPDFVFDPSLMLVSFGNLPGCSDARAECEEPGKITFYWQKREKLEADRSSDLVMVLAYNPEKKLATADTAAARRASGKAELNNLIKHFGEEVHVYLSFTSSDRERVSNSQYLGKVQLKHP